MIHKRMLCLALLICLSACARQADISGACCIHVSLDRGFINEWAPFTAISPELSGGSTHAGGDLLGNFSSGSGEGAILLIGVIVVVAVVYVSVICGKHVIGGTDVALVIQGEGVKAVEQLHWGDNVINLHEPVMARIQNGSYTISLVSSGTHNMQMGIPIAATRTLHHQSNITFAKNGNVIINGERVNH